MAVISLQKKNHREAAELWKKQMKNVTESEAPGKVGVTEIILEGEFTYFDRFELDNWGGPHMRFIFRGEDEPKERDSGFYEMVGVIASQDKALAGILTAKATLQVFKQITIKTKTETWKDGRYQGTSEQETQDWEDVTAEFAKVTDPGRGGGW